jgi:hypothetical protein
MKIRTTILLEEKTKKFLEKNREKTGESMNHFIEHAISAKRGKKEIDCDIEPYEVVKNK